MKFPFLFRIEKFGLLVSSFFFDSSFLTSKSAQVVQFSATNFTYLVHFDAIDISSLDSDCAKAVQSNELFAR